MRKTVAVLLMSASLASLSTGLFAADATGYPEKIRICTGGEGGAYEKVGKSIGNAIVKDTNIKVEILNTGGSVENAELIGDGDCDLGFMQADVATLSDLPQDIKVIDSHTENVYWIYGKSNVDDFGDMEDDNVAKKYAFAAVKGSGPLVTVKNWIKTDEDYKGARVVEFDTVYEAAEAVAQGFTKTGGITVELAGMLYIGRSLPTDITGDFSTKLKIGEVNDSSFASAKDTNGNPMYVKCEIQKTNETGLKTSGFGAPDSYCMTAQVVYNNAWHKQVADPKEAKKLYRKVSQGINSITKVTSTTK